MLASTGGNAPPVDFRTAVFRGLAPDGGLYLPMATPTLPRDVLQGFRERSFREIALEVARHLVGDELSRGVLRTVVHEALDFPVPLRRLSERIAVLELFHGPTLAFKDVGARFLARVVTHLEEESGRDRATVLVATSGDTGSAVGDAFRELASSRVVILFPRGKTSRIQQRHIVRLGGNVEAVAVEGTFDDCQRLVKAVLGAPELRRKVRLTSANSINVGRLLPQTFFYFHALARLRAESDGGPASQEPGGEVVFAVPSGNFGNLTAGLLARRMGLEGVHFVAATNANDVVPRYLETGEFAPGPSVRTISNAMDVGDPSNFERILELCGGDVERVRRELSASSHDVDETLRCIARVHERSGYLLDPHSAVGYLALREELSLRPEATGVLLATAHPGKFAEVVERVVEGEVPVPDRFAGALEGEPRVTPLEPEIGALEELLLGH